jgi:hypothetical protein
MDDDTPLQPFCQNVELPHSKDAVSGAVMEETLMINDVKDWNRRLQDALEKAFPGKQLKVDENTKSVSRMTKDRLDRRGIAADKAVAEKERR